MYGFARYLKHTRVTKLEKKEADIFMSLELWNKELEKCHDNLAFLLVRMAGN